MHYNLIVASLPCSNFIIFCNLEIFDTELNRSYSTVSYPPIRPASLAAIAMTFRADLVRSEEFDPASYRPALPAADISDEEIAARLGRAELHILQLEEATFHARVTRKAPLFEVRPPDHNFLSKTPAARYRKCFQLREVRATESSGDGGSLLLEDGDAATELTAFGVHARSLDAFAEEGDVLAVTRPTLVDTGFRREDDRGPKFVLVVGSNIADRQKVVVLKKVDEAMAAAAATRKSPKHKVRGVDFGG